MTNDGWSKRSCLGEDTSEWVKNSEWDLCHVEVLMPMVHIDTDKQLARWLPYSEQKSELKMHLAAII